ncbi:MAG: RNA polymerase sigma factor, partial [Lachnospiraceae bacterium]|nr:RNA polymerase sigma factor [Lachnospiraceae bacterium]
MELDDLYQEYAKMIYHFIYLKCNDKDLAEDIVQTTFLKAVSQIDSFQGRSKISTWLCQIAKNEYLNYCRKHNR